MKRINHITRIRIAFTAIICCISSTAFAQQKLTLQFKNMVGDEVLELGKPYKNPFGEDMVINKFKYYVSNIFLLDNQGKSTKISSDYFLIDEADSTSKSIQLPINIPQIKAIYFLLGVDSIRNVSGVQTGALDPMNSMFWTWNSGYVFAKLEGVSKAAKVAGNLFSWHVGGFRYNENALRVVRINIGNNVKTKNLVINIASDINQWFEAKQNLKISQHPICHSPGELAMKFADNYATMFSISTNN